MCGNRSPAATRRLLPEIHLLGIKEARAKLKELRLAANEATRAAVVEGAHVIQARAMEKASGPRHRRVGRSSWDPPGHMGGEGPDVRSGMHRRSFIVRGPTSEGYAWRAQIGPTMVYSRALELGNPRTGAPPYPSLGPGVEAAKPELVAVFHKAWKAVWH